jgi:acyl-CoA reductase-like NAD-dependent aldehyde dehydrogenase
MIPTWNFPVFVAMQKLAPALATGCTMVFKSSPYGPLINLFLAEICAEADLPPGVVNWVTGQSTAISQALCEDPRIDKISFTGSVGTGKAIMAAASKTLKRVHLELGGKSVGLYLDTDNLQMQAMTACGPAMFHAGQGCAMSTRVLVPSDKHDDFVATMAGFVQGVVKVGDPADPTVMLGPVIREERRTKIEEYIESGRKEGATLVTGGGRPKDLPKGYFLEPTIFANVKNSLRIAQEEIFGPVVAVIPYKDVDEAVKIANDSTYGLGGGISSSDVGKAVEVAKRIRTGVVWINNGLLPMTDAPFGGFKESGIGREGGKWGMEEYTEVQQITWKA